MLRLTAATTMLFALGPVLAQAPAGDPEDRQVFWQRSLEDAQELCRATGRPLLLAVNMDGESASDRIVRENYRDPAFVALTRRCVCLGASLFRHNARDHDDAGRRIPCPRFGDITCGEHIALEPVLFEGYLSDGERVAPRHALVMPDGQKAFDLSLCFDLLDIDRALAAALESAQQHVSPPSAAPADPAPAPATDPAATPATRPEPLTGWAMLAADRDCRGRARLEAALSSVTDQDSTMAALAAIGEHGDAGSMEALRLLLARLHELSETERAALRSTALGTTTPSRCFDVVRGMVQSLGAIPGLAGPDLQQNTLLSWLEPLESTDGQRSFRLACWAIGLARDTALQQFDLGPPDDGAPGAASTHRRQVDVAALLQTASAVTGTERGLPKPGGPTDALPSADDLQQELLSLDAVARDQRDADWHARFAKASLDLGRRHIETGESDAQLLLEDAAISFGKALEATPERYEWWIERARAAYFLQRFDQQVEFGRRALTIPAGEDRLPAERDLFLSAALHDARAIEALRWIGDGHARLLADRAAGPAPVELDGMVEGLRAYGVVCASPFGHEKDWQSFASFCGALGLCRQQFAIARCGALRYPASNDLRQALNAALWYCGRPDLSGVVAQSITRAHAPSADTSWHEGYAWIIAAEDARRTERGLLAARQYDLAIQSFRRAAVQNPGYADSCRHLEAVATLGKGFACARAGTRGDAMACLRSAMELRVDLTGLRDGLGYDVLDLIDKIVEWRADSRRPVTPLALLDQLDAVEASEPFWAVAVSDSALREALRADGKNPLRVDRETVDAAGNKIIMPMGLPTDEGDVWLTASIKAGRLAAARARTEADKLPLAQSLVIQAERAFERQRLDGIQPALAEAAEVLRLEPPAADSDEAALRALCQRLRGMLGEARPRMREGR